MQNFKKLPLLVLGFTLASAIVAYADQVQFFADFFTEKPGAEDRYNVVCGAPTSIYAFMEEEGPFFDNIFQVKIKCKAPKQSGTEKSFADFASDNISVDNCVQAQVEFNCAGSSTFCDDDYFGEITCDGESIDAEQVQDR